ncbi:MAG: hypothetical protein COC22_00665 [Flavobacteriaceae bacterium]|nr:MAG: hypothetical protein COC22_00665 [Flavobacteriaceae bacterium]
MVKILLIDDLKDNLIALSAIINDEFPKAKIITALDGATGIELAKFYKPELILLDILMPEMDGFEVCRILKEDDNTKDIPVVFVTAIKENRKNKIKALQVGAEGFLIKPIDEIELVAQVNAMLKIKAASDFKLNENKRLENLVEERIKEIKKNEKIIIESEKILRSLYDNAPLPFHSLNDDGCIINVNPAWLKVLGYNKKEVLNKWYGDFLHDDFKLVFKKNFPKLKDCGSVSNVPFKLRCKDGRYIDISLNGSSSYNTDGSFKQTYCVFQDITERKKEEQKLINSEERFRNSITFAPYPIMIHSGGKVIQLSNIWTELTGYTIEEIPTIAIWTEYAYGKKAVLSKKFIDKLYKLKRTQYDGEWNVQTKDGRTRIWDFSTSPIGEIDGEMAVISMAVDVTKRKKSELKIIEQMDELSRFNKLMVGRENKMVELKREINNLHSKLNLPKKYNSPDKIEEN